MASIKLTGDTSGVITVSAPAASGTNTITLPASTGTMALTSNIPGAEIPSQSGNSGKFLTTNGSAASWGTVASGGMTLLKTLNTTSGTSHAADSLDLSTYKFLYVSFYNVGWATDGRFLQWKETGSTSVYITAQIDAGNKAYGVVIHDLSLGIGISSEVETSAGANFTNRQNNTQGTINTAIDTATTSITFDWADGTAFNTGTIKLYGLK